MKDYFFLFPDFPLPLVASFLFPYLVKFFKKARFLFLLMIWSRIHELTLLILQELCSGPVRISITLVTTVLENIFGKEKFQLRNVVTLSSCCIFLKNNTFQTTLHRILAGFGCIAQCVPPVRSKFSLLVVNQKQISHISKI